MQLDTKFLQASLVVGLGSPKAAFLDSGIGEELDEDDSMFAFQARKFQHCICHSRQFRAESQGSNLENTESFSPDPHAEGFGAPIQTSS